jgi:hypothetical protein
MASGKLCPKTSIAREEVPQNLASVRAYIDAATQDSAFPKFIQEFKQHLTKPTNSIPGGTREPLNLPQISNHTEYFGKNHLQVRERGFAHFSSELKDSLIDKRLNKNEGIALKFHQFIDAIRPSK